MVYLVYLIYLSQSIKKVYHVYGVIIVKKTEYITFRAEQSIKEALDKLATEKKWTISFLVQEIIKDWLKDHANNPNKL